MKENDTVSPRIRPHGAYFAKNILGGNLIEEGGCLFEGRGLNSSSQKYYRDYVSPFT